MIFMKKSPIITIYKINKITYLNKKKIPHYVPFQIIFLPVCYNKHKNPKINQKN